MLSVLRQRLRRTSTTRELPRRLRRRSRKKKPVPRRRARRTLGPRRQVVGCRRRLLRRAQRATRGQDRALAPAPTPTTTQDGALAPRAPCRRRDLAVALRHARNPQPEGSTTGVTVCLVEGSVRCMEVQELWFGREVGGWEFVRSWRDSWLASKVALESGN